MKIGPQYKIARRLGERVFPKTQTTKFTVSGTEKKQSKGKHGRKNMTAYGQQLLEKQKARYTYRVSEKQFGNYVKKAHTAKHSSPVANLFKALETRLDNVVFRLGFVGSRSFARQACSHGHIMVNGRRVTIPSCTLRVGDKISIRPQSKDNGAFRNLAEKRQNYTLPTWLSYDETSGEGEIKAEPVMGVGESNLNFNSIIEFYSRV